MAQNENRWRNEGRPWSDDDRGRGENRDWGGRNRNAEVYDRGEDRGYGRGEYGRGDYGRGAYDVGDYGRSDYGGGESGRGESGRGDYGRSDRGRGMSDWQGGRETYGHYGRESGRDERRDAGGRGYGDRDYARDYGSTGSYGSSGGYGGREGSSGFGGYGGSGYAREDRMGRDFGTGMGSGMGSGMGRDYGSRSDWGRSDDRGSDDRGSSDWGSRHYGGDYGRGRMDRDEGYGEGRGFGGYRGWRSEYGYGEDRDPSRRWSSDWGSDRGREHGRRDRGEERGFLERAGDEIASWFGDDDAGRRRREDEMRAQHRGRGPRGYSRSDDRVREDINDRLTDDSYVDASEIDVTVSSGEVTLTGTVDNRMAKRRAEDIAESISGVRHVQNNLRVRERMAAGTSGTGATGTGTTGTGTTTAGASAMAGMGTTNTGTTGATSGSTTGSTATSESSGSRTTNR